MSDLYPSIAQCAVVATALKVLLFPAYKSTDFEVHRNWLAITNSLPLQKWYFEDTSEWTLDYPPFFAYFEWLLSKAAQQAHPLMLSVKNLGYDSWQTVFFQRSTVIAAEFVLIFALYRYVQTSPSKTTAHAAALSILLSPGLLIIDHIHFQYNGFLYGILILSLALARKKSNLYLSGWLFAALLCFKHIYAYLVFAYIAYLLRVYCLAPYLYRRSPLTIVGVQVSNCIWLGGGIAAILAAAFGPFALLGGLGQLDQIRSRLFPFQRGLCHAYWAPNVWAMYSFADRILALLAPYLNLSVNQAAKDSLTRGLVGDTSFVVLPEIPTAWTFYLTFLSMAVPLAKLMWQPNWDTFVGAVTLCGYASFLFGYHVHEKAILLVILPFSLLALKDRRYLNAFRPLAVAGHVSLFPLLFTEHEYPVKLVYTLFWLVTFLLAFDQLAPASSHARVFFLDRISFLYIGSVVPLILYCSIHPYYFHGRYEFLPLMFMSVHSAVGVVGSWIGFYVVYMTS